MKTLSSLNFKNKTVLLRADLNSEVINNRLIPSERIKESTETIKELKKKKAKIVIIAHQGRPKQKDFISLKKHANELNKYTKIKFIPKIATKKVEQEIQNLRPGEALLLENIRFHKDEFHPKKNNLVKFFLPLIDIYINDAFSNSHRKHTSMVSFPKYFPNCAGRLLEKEVKALKKIHLKKTLFILGGAKPEDDIKLLNGNTILSCGIFGQICAIAKGRNFGAQNKFLKDKLYITKKLKNKLKNVLIPIDFAVRVKSKRKELTIDEFPSKYEIYDIGGETIRNYKKIIKKAKSIYMKGPAGHCGYKPFCKGTREILKEVSNSKAYTIVGGGQLTDAIKELKIPKKKFNHVSLSGGALLRHIAGEKLPGLEALK
jgi:phosphoglycerate kinase